MYEDEEYFLVILMSVRRQILSFYAMNLFQFSPKQASNCYYPFVGYGPIWIDFVVVHESVCWLGSEKN